MLNAKMVQLQLTNGTMRSPVIFDDFLYSEAVSGDVDFDWGNLTLAEVRRHLVEVFGFFPWPTLQPVQLDTWSASDTNLILWLSDNGVTVSQTASDFAGFPYVQLTLFAGNCGITNGSPAFNQHQQNNQWWVYVPVLASAGYDPETGTMIVNASTAARRTWVQFLIYNDDPPAVDKWHLHIEGVSLGGTTGNFYFNNSAVDPVSTDDPYTGAGYPASTAPGGASGGSFDFTDDGLTGVHTPGLDLLNSGLITAWRPTKAILAQLASWLWVTTPGRVIQQLFGNPINAIIGLNIVPVSPPVDGGTNTIKFGNEDSHVACPMVTSQHVTVDCGSLTIAPIYGSYMDYAPNTSAELYLPYVGGLPIDVNDVIGKTLSITYQVDVLSGACVAYVHVNGKLHYQRSGSCAATAPITGSQMPNVVSGVLSIAGSVAGFFATAGAGGAGTAANVASGIATATSVAASAANMFKQQISYAGTVAGWAGLLGAQKPYLVLSVPNAAIPAGQAGLMGYPAWVGGRLGDFHGRTSCAATHLTIPTATDEEIEEIKGLLETGVYLP